MEMHQHRRRDGLSARGQRLGNKDGGLKRGGVDGLIGDTGALEPSFEICRASPDSLCPQIGHVGLYVVQVQV